MRGHRRGGRQCDAPIPNAALRRFCSLSHRERAGVRGHRRGGRQCDAPIPNAALRPILLPLPPGEGRGEGTPPRRPPVRCTHSQRGVTPILLPLPPGEGRGEGTPPRRPPVRCTQFPTRDGVTPILLPLPPGEGRGEGTPPRRPPVRCTHSQRGVTPILLPLHRERAGVREPTRGVRRCGNEPVPGHAPMLATRRPSGVSHSRPCSSNRPGYRRCSRTSAQTMASNDPGAI